MPLNLLDPSVRGQNPNFPEQPRMRENRYCETTDEALAFVEHCKTYTALNQPGVVVKMTWEIYGLDPIDLGEYSQW